MSHDFFLSYAAQDNQPAIPGRADSAWVTTFHGALVGRLQYYLGRAADVFFDRGDLAGNDALTPAIEAALDGSHLFIGISSPTYYRRPWCKLERQRFVQRLGGKPAEARRVFVIHTIDVDPLIQPNSWQAEFFPDLRGYYFFRKDVDGRSRTLGAPTLQELVADASAYYTEIDRLAQDMAARIRELEALPAAPKVAAASVPGGDAVFLAENAFRSHAEREELRVALRDAGFEVRPAVSLAGKPPGDLAAAFTDALAFVQIVSPTLLEIPGSAGTTYDHQQLETARAAGLPRFRWRALDLDLAAGARSYPSYAEFAGAPDVRQQLFPQFTADLLAALAELRAKRRVKQAAPGDARLVLVTGEQADLDSHAEAVTRQLRNHALGFYVTDAPAEEIAADDVNGFLVLYGGSSAEWVRDRLRLVRTLPRNRQRDLRVGVYFCAPPPDGVRRLLFDMETFKKIRWDDPNSFTDFANAVAASA